MELFFYKAGKFETRKKWTHPNIKSIVSFFNQVFCSTDILKKYHVIIRGGCLYKELSKTNDIDINLSSSSIDSYDILENDFLILQNIANQHNILLDISWSSISISNFHDMDLSLDNIYENLEKINGIYVKIGFFQKIVNGDIILNIDNRNELNSVGEYLVKYELKDLMINAFNRPSYSKWILSNKAPIKYLEANQIISGDYSALISESNKII